MRKLIVRIFNLVYLAASVVAILCLCLRPVISLSLSIHLDGKEVGDLLSGLADGGSSDKSAPLKAYTFDIPEESEEPKESESEEGESGDSSDKQNFNDLLTPERIAKHFDKHGGLNLALDVTIQAKSAFSKKTNTTILYNTVVKSIQNTVSSVIGAVLPPLKDLLLDIGKELGSSVMYDEVNKQLETYLSDGSAGVSKEQVDALFDHVFDTLDSDQPVSVDSLADAILGTASVDPATGETVYTNGSIYGILTDLEASGDLDLGDKSVEEIVEKDALTDVMVQALDEIDQLVYKDYTLADPQPTKDQVEADMQKEAKNRVYYVKRGDEYVLLNAYDPLETYYVATTMINNVDQAIAELLAIALNLNESSTDDGSGPLKTEENGEEESKAILRAPTRASGDSETKSTDEQLEEAVMALVTKYLPADQIEEFTKPVDQYAGMVILIIIGLFSFPWLLFALVTLIRTLRKKKIWTKPWIVFVFAFLQLIFGLVLTYGTKYAVPIATDYLPEEAGQYLGKLTVGLKTGCFIPSFIYLAFIPLTIAYIIVCHPIKVEYKQMKRVERYELRKARENQ